LTHEDAAASVSVLPGVDGSKLVTKADQAGGLSVGSDEEDEDEDEDKEGAASL
jgi:hypothetical protein